MDPEEERDLVEKAKIDPEAFGILFDTHYQSIFGYTLRRTASAEIAADLTSEIFRKALAGIHSFTWKGIPFKVWLYRIAGNEIKNHFRYAASHQHLYLETLMGKGTDFADAHDIFEEIAQAEESIIRHASFLEAQRAITTLPIRYQEVIALRFFEQKTQHEISSILGKKSGTVKSLLSRGIAKLKAILQPSTLERVIDNASVTESND